MSNNFFIILILFILTSNSCATAQDFSKYKTIDDVKRENSYCNQRFSKDGKFLNGFYKVSSKKGSTIFASYKDGYYKEVFNQSKGMLWSKEKFNEDNNLVEYVSYFNPKRIKEDEYYQVQKYDSIKTFFQPHFPEKSIIYFKNKMYILNYTVESKYLKITTELDNFKIFNSMDVFMAIPAKFFFSDCYNSKFIFGNNSDYRNRELYVEIKNTNKTIQQKFVVGDSNKKDSEINYFDYFEIEN